MELSQEILASLSPETIAHLQYLKSSGGKPFYQYGSVAEARTAYNKIIAELIGQYNFTGKTQELTIPAKGAQDGITTRVYQPSKLSANPAILVFFHGGGFVMGGLNSREVTCQILADKSECIVANVDYRLSPEFKQPIPINDCLHVTEWILANKEKIGGTAKSIVGVGGDSAGATISASICFDVPGIKFQVLVFPKVCVGAKLASHDKYRNGPFLDQHLMDWFGTHTFGSPQDIDLPVIKHYSILREKFDTVPPALFIVAECDMLRDESYEYQKKLEENGVKTDLLLVKGVIHGYFGYPAYYPNACAESYNKVAAFIKEQHAAAN